MIIKVVPKAFGNSQLFEEVVDLRPTTIDGISFMEICLLGRPSAFVPLKDFDFYEVGWTQLQLNEFGHREW